MGWVGRELKRMGGWDRIGKKAVRREGRAGQVKGEDEGWGPDPLHLRRRSRGR